MSAKRLYAAVAACAVLVSLGALWNRFAWDDTFIILGSDLVRSPSGWWRAFASPYWPPVLGGFLYRPLTVATYVLDWRVDGAVWFHAVNLLWHAAVSVLVALLTRRWAGDAAALVAGVMFAVHPVHVEAVANVVGRAELMAAAFTLLSVYAAIERRSAAWSAACWVLGLLCKESAAVAPALVVTAWALGVGRPSRREAVLFGACWLGAGAAYLIVRELVLHPYAQFMTIASVFVGQHPAAVRLTALAALADVTRLLLFPLTLRADYAPNERTVVVTPLDGRFVAGLLCLVAWGALLGLVWRRGRRIEALGLAWIALAYAPVANLLFPIGVLLAERTLYLPSVGLALAAGALAKNLRGRPLALLVGGVGVLGGARTALRVPVWRSTLSVTLSVLQDSPQSYVGPMTMAAFYFEQGRADKVIEASRIAESIFPFDARPYLMEAHAALKLKHPRLADSLLARADRLCNPCQGVYAAQAANARRLGDTAVAEALLAHARRLGRP
ncbi:MAG: hypothetical protein DMD49_05395 [Gemmatimonadetes bacterium]|nr:MAG: hypothetical protein DMD49_05395 [Gemmatimonadota bacterium]